MARLVGLLLLVLGIYLGVSIYANGAKQTLESMNGAADQAAADQATDGDAETSDVPPSAERATPGRAAPSAITSRVRERVTRAIEEGARRDGGE